MAKEELNLFGVSCPMNFVKTKIKLDTLEPGDELSVYLDAGEAIESVSNSVEAEGHKILNKEVYGQGWKLLVLRS